MPLQTLRRIPLAFRVVLAPPDPAAADADATIDHAADVDITVASLYTIHNIQETG